MRLTTKGHFAVNAMIDLALHRESQPVVLASISERQKIPLQYLEQLFRKLRRSGLVHSVRGARGGYCLAKEIIEIAVADIVKAVDDSVEAVRCGGKQNCRDSSLNVPIGPCLAHGLWSKLTEVMLDFLSQVKLADLVHQHLAGSVHFSLRDKNQAKSTRLESFLPSTQAIF